MFPDSRGFFTTTKKPPSRRWIKSKRSWALFRSEKRSKPWLYHPFAQSGLTSLNFSYLTSWDLSFFHSPHCVIPAITSQTSSSAARACLVSETLLCWNVAFLILNGAHPTPLRRVLKKFRLLCFLDHMIHEKSNWRKRQKLTKITIWICTEQRKLWGIDKNAWPVLADYSMIHNCGWQVSRFFVSLALFPLAIPF